jgi:enamine deaminase RidA (YjgF/YER057c/UK114 family)
MQMLLKNPGNMPSPAGGYSQAVEIQNPGTLLFISGQIGEMPAGDVPEDFKTQCEMIWSYIEHLLAASNMTFRNLVKVNTFLTDKSQSLMNSTIRNRFLGDHHPALTVVIVQTLDTKWLLEIDAVAAN